MTLPLPCDGVRLVSFLSRIIAPLSEEAYKDYKGIISVFQNNFLNNVPTDANVIFNPVFGDASRCLGGADGDIIINNSIIDFKYSKNINTKHALHSKQLAGYCILNHANPICKIDRMCIYSGRTGVLHQYKISDDIDSRFVNIANDIILPLIDKYRMEQELHIRKSMPERYYNKFITSGETVKSLSLKISEWDIQHPNISHNYTSSRNIDNLSYLYAIMLSIDDNEHFWDDFQCPFSSENQGLENRCTFHPKKGNGDYIEFKKK